MINFPANQPLEVYIRIAGHGAEVIFDNRLFFFTELPVFELLEDIIYPVIFFLYGIGGILVVFSDL